MLDNGAGLAKVGVAGDEAPQRCGDAQSDAIFSAAQSGGFIKLMNKHLQGGPQ